MVTTIALVLLGSAGVMVLRWLWGVAVRLEGRTGAAVRRWAYGGTLEGLAARARAERAAEREVARLLAGKPLRDLQTSIAVHMARRRKVERENRARRFSKSITASVVRKVIDHDGDDAQPTVAHLKHKPCENERNSLSEDREKNARLRRLEHAQRKREQHTQRARRRRSRCVRVRTACKQR